MIASFARSRVLPALNLGVLGLAWAAMVSPAAGSPTVHPVVLAISAAVVVVVLGFTYVPGARVTWLAFRDRRIGPRARGVLAVAPWLALFVLVFVSGLWWTQRPSALRVFATCALVDWSVAWCVPATRSGLTGRAALVRSSVLVLAAACWALGLQGLALGLTPFGGGTSAAIAVVAACACALAFLGSHSARVNLLTASVATLLTLATVETAVRVMDVGVNLQEADSRDYARQFLTLTPPGAAFVNRPKALDEFGPALIEINSLGIRGPEIPEARADLLLLGDSFIEARQLPWDRTLGALLQEEFRRRSTPLRVVSHGMRGWSPLLEWNWYLKVGRKLAPRVVMLFFFWNDLWPAGDEATTFRAVMRADGRPDHFEVVVESNWLWYQHVRVLRLLEGSWREFSLGAMRRAFVSAGARNLASAPALDDAAADRLARSVVPARPFTTAEIDSLLTDSEADLAPDLRSAAATGFWPGLRPLTLWTNGQLEAASRAESELAGLAEDVAADGGEVVIVYVPNPLQVGASECSVGRLFDCVERGVLLPPDSGVQAWLRGVAGRHRIELIDPTEAMRVLRQSPTTAESSALYLRADCHWSDAGHRFMADALADWYEHRRPSAGPPR